MKGKEVKIGLSIIGVLLCVFGAVLFTRLRRPDTDAATAAKNAPKNSQDRRKQAADDKGQDAEPADASQAKPDGERKTKSGPALGHQTAPAGYANEISDEEPERYATGDAWPERANSGRASDGYPNESPTQDDEAAAGDRYSGRYDNSYEMPLAGSSRAIGGETGDAAFDEELPAALDGGQDDAFAPANDLAGEQPADGYGYERLPDEFAGQTAGGNSLSSPGKSGAYGRGLPIGDAALDEPDGELELMPGTNAGEVPPAELSDDAVAAEVEAAAQDMHRGYGYANSKAPAGRSGYSAVSRRSNAYDRPAEDEGAYDALAGDSPADRRFDLEDPWDGNQPGGEGVYFVEANDSFASISKKVYGKEGYFKALHEYNRERFPNPSMIDVGDEIATPDVAVLEQTYPKLCPKRRNNAPSEPREGAMRLASNSNAARGGRTYLVAEGDTLFDIAKRELGKASRWREIYDLNQDMLGADFNYLSPGMELALPDGGEKPDPVADRRYLDGSGRRR